MNDEFWKLNSFNFNGPINSWELNISDKKSVRYWKALNTLSIINWEDNIHFKMLNPTINDLIDGIRLCKINFKIKINE